ncbi:dienelactone hydrolase family protein [Sphingomonas sabuli]|uniref:Dienelactone hydrolase family protein n=1 Tax=Sphingomonas sabuli TaxID=2764186 RepID=A0A7G9L2H5_9SPHN|nr:dienelactone hydrolase family protein [Sphingomonas sabuli]QNM82824.1 dienelactone hydrolase family protein [Sphingomonas sabuli]
MTKPTIRQQAIDLYDRFTHEGMDRRVFMGRMAAIAGSVAAAEALIASIAASPAAAAIVPADDPRIRAGMADMPAGEIPAYRGYFARPAADGVRASIMVIHENRGLNEHIRDVTRRLALAGYDAVAPDFLSPSGGTPANEDAARDAIGKLDLAQSVTHAAAMMQLLKTRSTGNGKAGAVGFCWGGGFVDRLAVASGNTLDAAVSYYGPAPDPAYAAMVKAPMQLHLPGLDERVATTMKPWAEALRAGGKTVEFYEYPGANHAFNNDTSAERYDQAAATLAWTRTLDFFGKYLAA